MLSTSKVGTMSRCRTLGYRIECKNGHPNGTTIVSERDADAIVAKLRGQRGSDTSASLLRFASASRTRD